MAMQDLLFSYNIAVDISYEMKEVLGKSAASVGLQPPEEQDEINQTTRAIKFPQEAKDIKMKRNVLIRK
ncbi:hypothetical protein ACE6H2_008288 [Prunus campanulata]